MEALPPVVGLPRASTKLPPLFPTNRSKTAHQSALAAKADGLSDLCQGADMLYNDRSYDGRPDEDGFEGDKGRGW